MGRSVSYASGSVAKVYYDVSNFGATYDDAGLPDGGYCGDQGQWEWEDFKEGLRHDIETLWPSFKPCKEWLGNEDLAFMENRFAYIGLSEYWGLACLWLVPKDSDGYYPEDIKRDNLARGWCSKITPKFLAKFGELNKLGSFSNGEAIYERKR